MEQENWTEIIDSLLSNTTIETTYFDFKQGIYELDNSLSENKSAKKVSDHITKYCKVLTACANNNLGKEGFVIIGICEGKTTARLVEDFYGIEYYRDSNWNNKFYVIGVNGEISKFANNNIDAYSRRILSAIDEVPVVDATKLYIKTHSCFISYRGKTLYALKLKNKKGERTQFGGKYYQRIGEETKEVDPSKLSSFLNCETAFEDLRSKVIDLQDKLLHLYSENSNFKVQIELLSNQRKALENKVKQLTQGERNAYELGYLSAVSNYSTNGIRSLLDEFASFDSVSDNVMFQKQISVLYFAAGEYEKAMTFIKQACLQGDAEAYHILGFYYHTGVGVSRDLRQAYLNYYESAQKGHIWGQYSIAFFYENGIVVDKDIATAIIWMKKSAEQGFDMAKVQMARYQLQGFHTLSNDNEAIEVLTNFSNKGNALAQFVLGNCYAEGVVVNEDVNQAIDLYNKSDSQGWVDAKSGLGILYYRLGKYDIAFDYLSKSTHYSGPLALFLLGVCYSNGLGVAKNYSKSFEYYLLSAEMNYPWAQHNLGSAYLNGNGTVQDGRKAFDWFLKAALQNVEEAQYKVAGYYYAGLYGIEKDLEKAFQWFSKSADNNYLPAIYQVAHSYEVGEGSEIDTEKAFELYMKCATSEYDPAQYKVGTFYRDGVLVEKDLEKAFFWFSKASLHNNPLGLFSVACCYYYGLGIQQDYEMAFSYASSACDNGCEYSFHLLGRCYFFGCGVGQDPEIAIQYFKKSYEYMKSSNDLVYIGEAYRVGLKDYSNAIEYYTLAAEYGDRMAKYNIGLCYLNGFGVSKDDKLAQKYLMEGLSDDSVLEIVTKEARNGLEENVLALNFLGIEY